MPTESDYWFPAKSHGWGWGPPVRWEGWAVLAGFVALVLAGLFLFFPVQSPVAFVVYTTVLVALLIGVCWLKGEPPRWRWGGK